MIIPIAVSTNKRMTPRVRDLVARASPGDNGQAVAELHEFLLEDISDNQVRTLLEESAKRDVNAPITLYDVFVDKIDRLRTSPVTPSKGSTSFSETDNNWQDALGDLLVAAERLWRDDFLQDASINDARLRTREPGFFSFKATSDDDKKHLRAQRRRLELLTRKSGLLLLLWVEASLSRWRLISNYLIREDSAGPQESPEGILHHVKEILHTYRTLTREWDHELKSLTGQRFFQFQLSDSGRLKSLGKEFGASHLTVDDRGWSKEASAVGEELRYQYYDSLLRERRLQGKVGAVVWYTILKVTVGYGTKPGRFLWTAIVATLAFTGLYFVSDTHTSGACASYQVPSSWPNAILAIPEHLYIAITTLVTLGSNPPPCGPGAGALLSTESILGYFLLAVLAALLIGQLSESER
jgi:hypothetical protein